VVLVGGGLSDISLYSSPLATTIFNSHMQATLFRIFKARILHTMLGLHLALKSLTATYSLDYLMADYLLRGLSVELLTVIFLRRVFGPKRDEVTGMEKLT
jgi:hypothetical protein